MVSKITKYNSHGKFLNISLKTLCKYQYINFFIFLFVPLPSYQRHPVADFTTRGTSLAVFDICGSYEGNKFFFYSIEVRKVYDQFPDKPTVIRKACTISSTPVLSNEIPRQVFTSLLN